MSYQALYRVWRPQQLKDVAGQEHITKTLQNALLQHKFSHAYLFSGPRGTGKTSAAKILAKAINCEKAPVAEPCNECASCQGITDGSVVDVIEIDAASNNGVDEIRYIRENVMAAPRDIQYKVYIIDEVHMLSTGAFNALLKTLEEPPKHVVFILATTEPHKIPLTIISRCQRFDFKRISSQELVGRMQYILEKQGFEAEEEALYLIARAAEGGMRDALSLLDQAISYAEDRVVANDILEITGAVSQEFLAKTAQSLYNKESEEAIRAANTLIREGKDPLQFMEDVIYYFRDLLLYKSAPNLDEVLDRAKADDTFASLADSIPADDLYDMIDELNHYFREMKGASHPKIFLEMALIRICNMPQKSQGDGGGKEADSVIATLQSQIKRLEKEIEGLKQRPPATAPATEVGQRVKTEEKQDRKPKVNRRSAPSMQGNGRIQTMLSSASKKELKNLSEQWPEVMRHVKQQSVPAHAWLSDSRPVVSDGLSFLLAFQNDMHRNMVDTKFRSLVEAAVETVTGKSMELVTILAGPWEKIKEDYKQKQQNQGETDHRPQDPLVDEAVKLVGSDLVEIIDE